MNGQEDCFIEDAENNTRTVRPDYAHKYFSDKRTAYVLLLVALAADCPAGRAV
jgi:hypothetical protein